MSCMLMSDTFANIICTLSDFNLISILSNFSSDNMRNWIKLHAYCIQNKGVLQAFSKYKGGCIPSDFGFTSIALTENGVIAKPIKETKFRTLNNVVFITFSDEESQNLLFYRKKIIEQLQKLGESKEKNFDAMFKDFTIDRDVGEKIHSNMLSYLKIKYDFEEAQKLKKVEGFLDKFRTFLEEYGTIPYDWWHYFWRSAQDLQALRLGF